MPWIITTDTSTFTAATISAEEDITTERTFGGGAMEHRFPVVRLSAVIIHTPDGQKTPVQSYTLRDPGPYEITWTAGMEEDV